MAVKCRTCACGAPRRLCADSVAAVNNEDALTDRELADMDARAHAATDGPWHSFVEGRDHVAGDDFIRTGGSDDGSPDMYVTLYYDAEPRPRPPRTSTS